MRPPPAISAISLVGLRGSGKTTIGQRLSELLGWTFLDLDDELERREERTIVEIFAQEGEAGFRRREAALIQSLPEIVGRASTGLVIATGGGAVLAPQNLTALKAATRSVYLRVSPAVSAARVARDAGRTRPALLEGGFEAEAAALLAVREPLYRAAAEVEVDASQSPAEVVAAIATALELSPGEPDPDSGAPTRPPAL